MEPVELVAGASAPDEAPLPAYEPPHVVTYRGEQILRMLGPVYACSFGHSVVACWPGSLNFVAPWENRPAGAR
jgi:hypothetical protein